MGRAVEATTDFRRIRDLPRRAPEPPDGLAEAMTPLLTVPGSKEQLRPLQALALHDIGIYRGGFLNLDVGEGKTIISLLAPYVLNARKPLLLGPASLIKKTIKERAVLEKDWRIPNNIRLQSYQMLGRADAADMLTEYGPDLLILDESHKAKNLDAAMVRRLVRYLMANPDVMVIVMTGTIMRTSLMNYAHLLRWSLKDGAPVPSDPYELEMWANALDDVTANTDEFSRPWPGALLEFCTAEEVAAVESGALQPEVAARYGFRRRLRETPGVVSSAEGGTVVEAGLTIRGITYDLRPETVAHFERLRDEGITPDGWEIEGVDCWRHCKELALGFHQAWDPRPPDAWLDARRGWFGFARAIILECDHLDSPEHVARACEAGHLPRKKLDAWRAIRDTFRPNPVPRWHDEGPLNVAAAWAARAPGIVATEHVEFARALSARTGMKYYGAKGLTDAGEYIEDATPGASVIMSVDANREGRNIQGLWSRMLITSPEEGWDKHHQLIGRLHRPKQPNHVHVDVFIGCAEHVTAWRRAMAGARAARDTVGAMSKLLIAEVDMPSEDEIDSWSGPRWEK